MEFNDYQNRAAETAIYPEEYKIIYPALGLGEIGEVQGKIKKWIRDKNPIEQVREQVKAELGDALWYISALARDLNLSLDEIAQANITKLQSRKERGVLGGSGDNR